MMISLSKWKIISSDSKYCADSAQSYMEKYIVTDGEMTGYEDWQKLQ